MTPFKYFVVTNISLIMFASSFVGGFFVGKENKILIHSHLITYTNPPDYKTPATYKEDKIPVAVVVPLPTQKTTDDEFDCLARTIYFEAGNQSYYGKIAVGSVVMNRVSAERYPDTICGVIKQHKQFSWYSDGKSDVPFKGDAWKDSIRAAKEVLRRCNDEKGVSGLFSDASVQHYHADYVSPKWAKKLKRVAKIDNHIFYR